MRTLITPPEIREQGVINADDMTKPVKLNKYDV